MAAQVAAAAEMQELAVEASDSRPISEVRNQAGLNRQALKHQADRPHRQMMFLSKEFPDAWPACISNVYKPIEVARMELDSVRHKYFDFQYQTAV